MRIRKTDRRRAVWIMTVVVLLLHGNLTARAQEKAPADPTDFLKWSMAHYVALTNFQADCYWSESFGRGGRMTGKRSLFLTTLPNGMKFRDPASKDPDEEEPKPPVPLDRQAPNFTVKTLTGKKRSLADFRGKVVLIDFWATWCGPCRIGLPETQRLAKAYKSSGLEVLAISDEDAKTVSPFLKSNHYTFPTYLDAQGKTATAYKIEGIPTTVVIDKRGRLVSYMVGLQDPATIKAALKKAGLNLK